ncbi:MAG: hypothetical protein CMM87_05370 [Rickettsiales bacterium]|nr:hypothetical protein [Rickettsiales bacterium]
MSSQTGYIHTLGAVVVRHSVAGVAAAHQLRVRSGACRGATVVAMLAPVSRANYGDFAAVVLLLFLEAHAIQVADGCGRSHKRFDPIVGIDHAVFQVAVHLEQVILGGPQRGGVRRHAGAQVRAGDLAVQANGIWDFQRDLVAVAVVGTCFFNLQALEWHGGNLGNNGAHTLVDLGLGQIRANVGVCGKLGVLAAVVAARKHVVGERQQLAVLDDGAAVQVGQGCQTG